MTELASDHQPDPAPDAAGAPAAGGAPTPFPKPFRKLLLNTLVSGVTSSFLWFALTFWVYLETRSVVATGVIGGSFGLSSAFIGPAFGTFVDHHRKQTALLLASTVSTLCFAGATMVFVFVDSDRLLRLGAPWFWLMVLLTLAGSVAGQMRGIAMATCVTLLVPVHSHDRANGLVGTVTGLSFAITSVFSGLAIAHIGMGWCYYVSLGLTAWSVWHLTQIVIDEPEPEPVAADEPRKHVDVRAAIEAIRLVPGLGMLIFLSAFNNLLGGVFMALMDAYGLELVAVETWGFLFGGISFAFILGGALVARRGLGRLPVRTIILCNLVNWTICATFTLRSSIIPLTIGMFIWMLMIPVTEAAEQTVLQRSIPYERQGRVFGFAQLVENAAAPFTAFMIGPVAERFVMPTMTDGRGADLIGDWFGTGPDRGLALMFTLAGLLGILVTVLIWGSPSYRRLRATWLAGDLPDDTPDTPTPAVA